jgi:3-methyladenine DNA glycosylase AlkD
MKVTDIIEELQQCQVASIVNKSSKVVKSFSVIGVKMSDIRRLAKKIGTNHSLAIELYKTNIYDAMMLSTLIASNTLVTDKLLKEWAKLANSSNIVSQGLAGLMLQTDNYGLLLKEWCYDPDEDIRYAGFTLLSTYFRMEDLEDIDIQFSLNVLNRIEETIEKEPLTIQNSMNNAVVMAGLHIPTLVEKATEVAEQIGYIMPLVAKNSCNIQSAVDYLVRYKENPKYSRVAKLNQKK